MTTQTAIIITQDYGASLSTPTLRNYLTDTLIVAADSANEVTADSGRYALVFTESAVHAAGWYALRAFVSGAPINRFVYFTGVDGETAIAVSDLPPGLPLTGQVVVTRPVGDDTPITFSFPVASATLSGTRRINNAGSTTALSGALSFLRTSGTRHLYSLAYNAADRPSDDGVVEYVFTDGTLDRTVVLRAVTTASGADTAGVTELLTRIPDAAPGTEGGLPLLSEDLTVTAALDSASRLAIWNTLTTESFTANSFGDLLIISDGTNGREVKVTGANHIAADVHDVQPDGLSGSTEITAINTFAARVTTGLVADGQVYQFTANMLELGPSGSSTVTVLPATGIVADRSAGTTLTPVVGETISQSITVYQSDGTTAVNLSNKTLKVIFETMSGVDVAVVAAADITISGVSSNVVTFAYPSAVTASERTLRFAIRDAAAPLTMYLQGVCSVVAAPKVDA